MSDASWFDGWGWGEDSGPSSAQEASGGGFFDNFDLGEFVNDVGTVAGAYAGVKQTLNKAELMKSQRQAIGTTATDVDNSATPLLTVQPSQRPVPGESVAGGSVFDNKAIKYGAMALGGALVVGLLFKAVK